MKKHLSRIFFLAMTSVMSLVSCTQEEMGPVQEKDDFAVPSIEEQILAVEATKADLEQISKGLEVEDTSLDAVIISLHSHIVSLEDNTDAFEATLATFALQKKVAMELPESYDEVAESVSAWLGDNFSEYFAVAQVCARLDLLEENLDGQKTSVDRYASRLEPDELSELSTMLDENLSEFVELDTDFVALEGELEDAYNQAFETALTNGGNYRLTKLQAVNRSAAVQLRSVDNSLSGLIARVAECETQIAEIKARLDDIEADVEELKELLDQIQSITFVSEFSEEYAVANYIMASEDANSDGMRDRTPTGEVELNFLVRPAKAASALATSSLWGSAVTVKGYYAQKFQLYAMDYDFIDFNITDITADASTGAVKVKVQNNFDNSLDDMSKNFYFRNIGAKLALSVTNGKTDMTSRFVEIVPRDASGTVYVESMTLSHTSYTLKKGDTGRISVNILPENATYKTVKWVSASGNRTVEVDANGNIEGIAAGDDLITVTADGVDEYGRTFTAECSVKVEEAITVVVPSYVEIGQTVELELDYNPNVVTVSSATWELSYENDNGYLTIDGSNLTGKMESYDEDKNEYKEIELTCTIQTSSDQIVRKAGIKVVPVQPTFAKLINYDDATKSLALRMGDQADLSATMLPANVDQSLFKLQWRHYRSEVTFSGLDSPYAVAHYPTGAGDPAAIGVNIVPVNDNYFVNKSELQRILYVTVTPYWVTGISFLKDGDAVASGGTIELEAGYSATLVPVFTSDVAGKEPNYRDLTWNSDNSLITVDENGKITAAAGAAGKSATITATTAHEYSVPSGSAPVTASITVNVTSGETVNIGDYLYNNGKFSPNLNAYSGASILGVVISKDNPRSTDTKLPAGCTHGLVMALDEGSGKWWSGVANDAPYSVYKYYENNNTEGYADPTGLYYGGGGYYRDGNGLRCYGYNNTLLFNSFMTLQTEVTSEIMTALKAKNTPSMKTMLSSIGVSEWYLPSIHELYLIYQAYANNGIGTKLTQAGGTGLSNEYYWAVSEISGNYNTPGPTMNPTTGAIPSTALNKTTSHKIRYILAF